MKLVSEVVKRKYGEVNYGYDLSVADENYFATRCGIPMLVLGPAGGGNHLANEWVSLKSVKELSEIIQEIFKEVERGIYGLVLVKRGDIYVGYTSFAPIKEDFIFNFEREFREGILPPSAISNNSPYFDTISMAVLERHRRSDLLKQRYFGKTLSQLMLEYIAKRALKEDGKALTNISESIYSYGRNKRLGYKIIGRVQLENNITANLMPADLNDELLKKIENYY